MFSELRQNRAKQGFNKTEASTLVLWERTPETCGKQKLRKIFAGRQR